MQPIFRPMGGSPSYLNEYEWRQLGYIGQKALGLEHFIILFNIGDYLSLKKNVT